MIHTMGPTAIALTLLLALVIDYMSVGPNSFRDRAAFVMGVVAVKQGFDGGPLDRWTVEQLRALVDGMKNAAGDATIAGASTDAVIGGAVGILFIYALGCLVPDRASKKLGRFAALSFPSTGISRINWKLWICAVLLGLLADLPNPEGAVRFALDAFLNLCTFIVAPIPAWLFGEA